MQTDQWREERAGLDGTTPADPLLMRSLAHNPLLHGFSEAQRACLAAQMKPALIERGAPVIIPPNGAGGAGVCNGLFVVMAGSVAVLRQGRAAPLTIHPGESFGEIDALTEAGAFEASACTSVHLFWIDAAGFRRFVMSRPDLSMLLVSALARRLCQTPGPGPHAGLLRPDARLARQLLWAAASDGSACPAAFATQKELGTRIGLSRESTNRLMRGWARAGIIRLGKARVEILDARCLRAIGLG